MSMVSVQLEPDPAITGMRPATRSTTQRMTSSSSSCVMVELSPVVPSARIASVPASRWKSTSRSSASKSTAPVLSKGVTSATIEPVRLRMSISGSFLSFSLVGAGIYAPCFRRFAS